MSKLPSVSQFLFRLGYSMWQRKVERLRLSIYNLIVRFDENHVVRIIPNTKKHLFLPSLNSQHFFERVTEARVEFGVL